MRSIPPGGARGRARTRRHLQGSTYAGAAEQERKKTTTQQRNNTKEDTDLLDVKSQRRAPGARQLTLDTPIDPETCKLKIRTPSAATMCLNVFLSSP